MQGRRRFNRKRRLITKPPPKKVREALAKKVHYLGHPHHKRTPGDFRLIPPAQPRPDKTLCDGAGITSHAEAMRWLLEGIKRGVISDYPESGFPQNVWAVTEQGTVLEARGDHNGNYHGYPLLEPDPFRLAVLQRWGQS
jgi:hypothetical protein